MDAHVHFHDVARVVATLDAAESNFRALGCPADGLLGMLLLAQSDGEQVFESLAGLPRAGDWAFTPARDEPETLIARRDDHCVAIVCGRQLRTDDGLEVLGLGTLALFRDRLPIAEAVRAVRQAGALPVVPWGFGKWLGRRGERIEALLAACRPDELFVGDNGGRLGWLPVPPLIRAAEGRGFRVLPGSDPFPFAADHRRVGAFGFRAETALPATAPWRELHAWLRARCRSPSPYGHGCGPLRFALNQAGIQIYRRLPSQRA